MIRLLNEADQGLVLDFLYQEPSYNIFPIGDIEAFGFNQDFLRIYGEFDGGFHLMSILLRYRQSAIYYAKETIFNHDYLDIFKKDPFNVISGKASLMDLIDPYLSNYRKHKTFFCRAHQIKVRKKETHYHINTLKTSQDCEKLFDFMSTIKEFKKHIGKKEDYIEGKLKSIQMGTTLYIEENNQIISTVATTAETTKNAMVVSVATAPSHRNQGLATALLVELMDVYIHTKNKSLCLFYDNPEAGKIYLKLGFEPIGQWSMYMSQKDHE
jgi:hypothetical protein